MFRAIGFYSELKIVLVDQQLFVVWTLDIFQDGVLFSLDNMVKLFYCVLDKNWDKEYSHYSSKKPPYIRLPTRTLLLLFLFIDCIYLIWFICYFH